MQEHHKFTIFADYFQFVLMDEESEDNFSEIWTEEALERMLAVGKNAICPGTLRNVEVSVEVNIVESESHISLSEYDHVAEASLEIPSGNLVVMSCTGYLPESPRIKLKPGNYNALFVVSGIETIKTEWEPASDNYIIYLWHGAKRSPKLIKNWKAGNA